MTTVETTRDAFLDGRVMVNQPRDGYRAGLDAVFLAAAAPVRPGHACRVLDVGAGAGTVGLCVAARCPDATVVLLEREPELAALASRNIIENGLENRAVVIQAAIGDGARHLADRGLVPDGFDHVLANPPYHAEGLGTAAPDALKAASHAMPRSGLDDWVRFMARMACPGGRATLVHKGEALAQVLAAFERRFGDLRILPLHPREDEPASRILVEGIKGSRAPLVLLPGLVLHAEGNAFTRRARAVLRDGGGLSLRH